MSPREISKSILNAIGLALVALPASTCWLERRLSRRGELFRFWSQFYALVPGLPGDYLRKCYYYLTLRDCSLGCSKISFLSEFTHREVDIADRVYIGVGARIATATLGEGCLIGSRASILSGGRQHEFDAEGRLTPFAAATARRVTIGAETWVGEGAIVMANVGSRCVVAAGAVVSQSVPDGTIVAGNPCRFVGRTGATDDEAAPAGETTETAQ